MFENKLSKIRKDLGVATIASLLSFAISLALAPIMTRYYEPADYGTFAIVNNLATFIATAILFSLPNAIPMESYWHRRAQLLRALIHLALFAFLLSSIGVILFLGYKTVLNQFHDEEWAFILLPFLVLAIASHRISQGWANADGTFGPMATARVAHPLIAKPFAIIASMLTVSSPLYIIFFEIVGYFFQSYIMIKGRVKNLKCTGQFHTLRRIRLTTGMIRRHHDYSLFLNLVNLSTLGFIMMQTVIITMSYSVSETGLFTLAMSMSSLPVQLIAMATAPIIYHKLIHVADKNPEQLFRITVKILMGYIALGIIPYLIIYFFGPQLFGLVFGEEWRQSGMVASLFALPIFMGFIMMPLSSVFRVTKTIKFQFMIDLSFILTIVILFYIVASSTPFDEALSVLSLMMSLHGLGAIAFSLNVTWKTSHAALKLQKNKA